MKTALNHLRKHAVPHVKRWSRPFMAALVIISVFLLVRSTTWVRNAYFKFVDKDPERGAKAVPTKDALGDQFSKVVYLDQGWAASDSLWFYNADQGSDLLPYDFFLVLEQSKSTDLFRADENINHFRYIPQKKTSSNPDALPVGMVADIYHGKKFMGFTCAACHCSQLNYQGTAIRIDGGPGQADMDGFMKSLSEALQATKNDPGKLQRFEDAVLKVGNYKKKADILNDLGAYAMRVFAYNFFNESLVEGPDGKPKELAYGYSRLDAFGRIYNRVLEHVVNPTVLKDILTNTLPPAEADPLLAEMKPVLDAKSRDHLVERLAALLSYEQQVALRGKVFNSPNAPVSYPFLWDIPQHDYVQWNGIGANSEAGPIGRNAGEVIGVFGTLDWAEKKGWTISSVLQGQGFGDKHIGFESSVKVHTLRQIEDRLKGLHSPLWKEAADRKILPELKPEMVRRGERLFDQYCASCHTEIDRESPNRRILAHMQGLDTIGTDPTMALNSVNYSGASGILRNWYVSGDVGSLMLDVKAPVAAILTKATQNVVATPDPDKWFFTRGADWANELISQIVHNEIKSSVKMGDYSPNTTAKPYESLKAYKGRSLNGIWATAPYLHNGSVPTLYDLLLPATPQPDDPPGTVYRPKVFTVGSREFEPVKVGFKHEGYEGFKFDTSLPGNSNAGHDYGTRKTKDEKSKELRPLNEQERWDLVEYLKSL
jgi:mono/diheme cytochrome c family protein